MGPLTPQSGAILATLSSNVDLNPLAAEPAPADPANTDPALGDLSRKQVLAAASPGLAALLNLLPGLGSGYIYQRRWRAYRICSALATAWFLAGALLAPPESGPSDQQRLVGLAGLLLLAGVTSAEAFLAGRRARMD